LVAVKEELEDPLVVAKIRQILRPKEYTKVDQIIDLVFSTAEDVKKDEKLAQEAESVEAGGKRFTPVDFRQACIAKLQGYLKTVLVKRSSALYSSADEQTGVICLNSRAYGHGKKSGYWFGFRRHQRDTILAYANGYAAFGCGSAETLIVVPAKIFASWLEKFHTTDDGERFYWHVRISAEASKITMITKSGIKAVDVTEYLVK
jgi:hypothetical protein